MRPLRWVSQVGPPLMLAAAVAAGSVALPASLLAGSGSPARGCPPATAFALAVGSSARGAAIDAQPRLTASLSTKGEVSGRVLTVNTAGGARTKSLASESFASAAQSNVVVFGQSDAVAGSTISAIDLQTGCEFSLWTSDDIVRSAVIDVALRSLYIHAVTAGDRTDLGVQRVDVASGTTATAVPPLAASTPFGVTFATALRWSLDGHALAVQSCGIAACRIRVLDLASGGIESYADPSQGQIVGLTAAKVVTFDACPDLPCGLAAVDRPSGGRVHFDIDAYAATLDEDGQGAFITVVTAAGTKEIRP
jgi:hypothetical protein